ncbi:MAG: prepilin-type N-terminal cleavage/methylation domain-containing protein [Pseudomonadota bacterium]
MMRNTRGFTLLELVLVLFILGLLATISTSFIETEDGQLRFDDSLARLDAIPAAVYRRETLANSPVLSGFVVDNGQLPPDPAMGHQLTPLIRQDGVWDAGDDFWLPRTPRLAYLSTEAGVSDPLDSGATPPPLYLLTKGFSGSYLDRVSVDTNNEYRDAWGDEFTVSVVAGDYTVSYDGADAGAQPKPSPFNRIVARTIAQDDWSVPLGDIDVTVLNQRASALPSDTYGALLVFENNAGATLGERWLTYHFNLDGLASGDDSNTISDVSAWSLDGVTGIDPAVARVPAGRHLFVVVQDPAGADNVGTIFGGVQFLVIPRSTQPSVTLELTTP